MALSSKERLTSEYKGEQVPIVEVGIPPEIESNKYLKEVNKEVSLSQKVRDKSGQVVMDNATPKEKITVTLPLTELEMNKALHLKVIYSLRWLAEWTKRLIKMVGSKFDYRHKMEGVRA